MDLIMDIDMNLAKEYCDLANKKIAYQEEILQYKLFSEQEYANSILDKEILNCISEAKECANKGWFYFTYVPHFLNRKKIKEALELKGFEANLIYDSDPYSEGCEFSIEVSWNFSCSGLALELANIAQEIKDKNDDEEKISLIERNNKELEKIPQILESILKQLKEKAERGDFCGLVSRIKQSQYPFICDKLKDYGFKIRLSDGPGMLDDDWSFMVYWKDNNDN